MKQKKFPAMAVVGIVLAFGVVATLNATGGNIDFSKLLEKKDKEVEITAPAESSKAENKATLNAAMVSKRNKPINPEDGPQPELKNGVPLKPVILIPKRQRRQEVMNDSMTSGHWDAEGSAVKAEGEGIREKRSAGQ